MKKVAGDPHRFANTLDAQAIARLVERLESRAKDTVFTRLFDNYVTRLALPAGAQVLEVGCGTGAMSRLLVQREDFSGEVFALDQCAAFIDAAQHFAQAEDLDAQIDFRVGDVHSLSFPTARFDAVIAHTLLSHVAEPSRVLQELARVVRPGGIIAVFDGDYASLTYACDDHEFGQQMDTALARATFNNPRIMREIPRLLPGLGLRLAEAWGDAVVEIGSGSFFRSFAEAYVPYVINAKLLPAVAVEAWLTGQRDAMQNGTFFAACTYYTYLLRRR